MSLEPVAGSVSTVNLARFVRIFVDRRDPDYTATPDERMKPHFQNAEVVKGVSIGEGGQILSKKAQASHVLVKVDLSYIPGEPDPLEVYPQDPDDLGRNHNKQEKGIMALDPEIVAKYPALFLAADEFNATRQPDKLGNCNKNQPEGNPQKIAS
jgi:hypothetical protein